MKKWVLAIVLCLTLTVFAGIAMADGLVLKDEAGNVLQSGDSLEGQFYYKVYVEGLEGDAIYTGWNEDMDAEAPYHNEWEPRGLGQDEGDSRKYLMIIPDPFDDYDQEIMFLKTSEDGPAEYQIAMHYDREPINTARPRITTSAAPQIGQKDNFTLEWTPVNGAFYFVRWTQPNGENHVYSNGDNSMNFGYAWDDPIEFAGNYEAEVVPLVNGHIGIASAIRSYWVDAPEANREVWLGADKLDENSEDNQVYISYGESINYHISAPGAEEIRFVTGEEIDDGVELDENGEADYFWMPGGDNWRNGDRTYVAFVQAKFGNNWVNSNSIFVNVHMDGEIEGDFNWSIQKEQGQGHAIVSQDGLVTIVVEPIENENVDFFGAYIQVGDAWIADSHWVEANNEETTIIDMPVPRCEAGTYDVHVYAARFGSPNKESEHVEQVQVTAPVEDHPIIISMKDSYETGEQISIRAYYSDPDKLKNAWMQVVVNSKNKSTGAIENEWYNEGKGFDFWGNDFQMAWTGTYILQAWIYQNVEGQEEPQEVQGTRTTFEFEVTADNQLAAPSVSIEDHEFVGGKLHLHFDETPHAERYSYWIHREGDNENLMSDGSDQPGDFEIDTNMLEPGAYCVWADVVAKGYNANNKRLYFVLLDENDSYRDAEDYSYYFSTSAREWGENNDLVADFGEDVRFIYVVPGAEQVKMVEFDENQEECLIEHAEGPNVVGWMTWNETCVHAIYGSFFKNGSWSEPILLCEISVMPRLKAPSVEIPMVVNAGQNVTITFHETENATDYSFWIRPEGEEGEETYSDSYAEPGDLLIPKTKLQANRIYHVYLDTNANGYLNGHEDRLLYVLGNNNTEGIWLDVPETISIGEAFEVHAGAEGAQDIFIRWDSDHDDIRSRYNQDWIDEELCVDNVPAAGEDQYTASHFTAFARINDNELLVQRATATLTGAGDDTQTVANWPVLTISEENRTVARNDYIIATVSTVDDDAAYEYHVNVFDENGEWYADYRQDKSDAVGGKITFLIPTCELPERPKNGYYTIGTWVRAHGKYSSSMPDDQRIAVTITQCENSFYVSKDTVEVCEPLTVSICAPGADRLRFSSGYGWNGDEGWDSDCWYSDSLSWDVCEDTVTICAEAMYDGQWRPVGSKRITINKKGDLDNPNLNNAPATVTTGTNLTFEIDTIPNAQWYYFDLQRLSDGRAWHFRAFETGNTVTIDIDGKYLDQENTGYLLQVSVFGTGYNAAMNETTFVTVPKTVAEHVITLEADEDEIESNNGGIDFTVTAEGATLVKIYHEDMWNWAKTDENGKATFNIGFNQDFLQPVWAMACYDPQYGNMSEEELYDIDMNQALFEGVSNVVNIRVNSYGKTFLPDWVHVQENVVWGEWLQVDIGGGGNAEFFDIRIRDKENNEEVRLLQVEGSGSYRLPTLELDPEREYYVTIDGCCPGYTWNGIEDEFDFTITAPEAPYDDAFMEADKDTVMANEPYYVMMYAPGAKHLMAAVSADPIYDVNATWDGEFGESDQNGFWWEEPGSYTLNGYAQYTEGGDWEQIGSVTLTVLPHELDEPEIWVESVVDNTKTFNIAIPVILGGDNYHIDIHEIDGNWDISEEDWCYRSSEDATQNPEGKWFVTFTVPADTLGDGGYWIDCDVHSNHSGVEGNWNSRAFLVNNGEIDDNITLNVEPNRAHVHEQVEVNVKAPGAKAILLRWGDHWRGYSGDEVQTEINEGQICTVTIYAQAWYSEDEQLPENLDQFDWLEELDWGRPGGIKTISFFANGKTGAPGFFAPDEIRRGEILTISNIWEGDGADETHANILWNMPEDGCENWVFGDQWQSWDEQNREIHLSTSDLEAGRTYWLAVDNSGFGLTGNRSWHEFRVTEENPTEIVFSCADTVALGKVLPVSIYAPGAWRVGFSVDGDKWHEDEQGNYRWNDGDLWSDTENIRWENLGDLGVHTITAYVQYYGEDWVAIPKTVMVTSSNLEIRVASVVDNAQDLEIIVPLVRNGDDYTLEIHDVQKDDEESYKYREEYHGKNTEAVHAAQDALTGEQYLIYSVPSGTLTDGAYWIDCYVSGSFSGAEGHKSILVQNNKTSTDSNIDITVDRTEVLINDEVEVSVTADGAKAIMIRWGDNSRCLTADKNGHVEMRISEYQPVCETLYAQACYDENAVLPEPGQEWNYNWSQITWSAPSKQTIEMHFIANGRVGKPDFYAPGEIRRGEILTVSNIYEGDRANETHANILWNNPEDNYEEWVFGDNWRSWNDETREIYLSTNDLEAGTYWLAVDNSGIGYRGNREWHEFRVIEDETDPDGVVFSAANTVTLGNPLAVSIFAPGALRIGFATDGSKWHEDDKGNYLWDDCSWWSNTEGIRWNDPDELGQHTITAYVLYTEGGEWTTIDRTVMVCDQYLASPEILVTPVVDNTQAVDIIVPLVMNGNHYSLGIHPVNSPGEGGYVYSKDLDDTDAKHIQDEDTDEWLLTFTVPAGTLENGGYYWIDCYTWADGSFFGNEGHTSILVQNGNAEKDNKIHITVDRTDVPINENFTVNVNAAGAKAFVLHWGDNNRGFTADENGSISVQISEYQPAYETLYAQACYDEEAVLPDPGQDWNFNWGQNTWGAASAETIQMHFISYGKAGEPDFDAPDTIVRGDVLKITNIYLGDGANEAHGNINRNGPREREDMVYGYGWHTWDWDARTIYMSTSMLEPGTYWVVIDNSGVGRENNRGWHEFRVVERGQEEQPASGMILDVPEKIQVGCTVPISVYAPGADHVGFGVDLDEADKSDPSKYELMMDGDIAYDMEYYRWNETGTHTITAYAKFGDNDPVIINKTVTICHPLHFDLLGLPRSFVYGQKDAKITIPMPENAEWIGVRIDVEGDGWGETIADYYPKTADVTCTIPAEYLTEGNRIRVDCYANADGFSEAWGVAYIITVPTNMLGAELTLAEGDINNIQTNQNVMFKVSPTEGHTLTAVRFFDGHGFWNGEDEKTPEKDSYCFDEDGNAFFWCGYNHNDEPYVLLTAYAEVRLDGSADWMPTNTIRFTVRTPNGPTGSYDFTDLSTIRVQRGALVEVEFTESENSNEYWADVFPENDGWGFNPSTTNPSGTTTVYISTASIPAGTYYIRGRAGNSEPGWRWTESNSSRRLIIVDGEIPSMREPTFTTPAMLTGIEEEAFEGIAAKVIEISGSVEWIDDRAFADSDAEQVIFRNGDTEVSYNAFEGCSNLVVYSAPGGEVERWAEWNVYTFYPIPVE